MTGVRLAGPGLERGIAATIAVFLALASIPAPVAAVEGAYRIKITGEGVVIVSFKAAVEPGLNPIQLPVEPVEATIEAVINGVAVPPLYVNGTLYIASDSTGVALVTYIGEVSVSGGVVSFNVSGGAPVELIVPPNVILFSLPARLADYKVFDNGTLVIAFTGPARIDFTLKEVVEEFFPAAPASEPPATPTTPATPREGVLEGVAGAVGSPEVLAAIAVILAAAAALYVKKSRGSRGESAAARPLADVDRLILNALAEAGGEALQSELLKATGLPKTTLWRRLKRLEEAGYVEIRREGKVNRVRLVRKPE